MGVLDESDIGKEEPAEQVPAARGALGVALLAELQFMLVACGLPLLMTVIMGFVSMVKLDAACKVCIGIYLCSIATFVAAAVAVARVRPDAVKGRHALWFGEGVAFVLVLSLAY